MSLVVLHRLAVLRSVVRPNSDQPSDAAPVDLIPCLQRWIRSARHQDRGTGRWHRRWADFDDRRDVAEVIMRRFGNAKVLSQFIVNAMLRLDAADLADDVLRRLPSLTPTLRCLGRRHMQETVI